MHFSALFMHKKYFTPPKNMTLRAIMLHKKRGLLDLTPPPKKKIKATEIWPQGVFMTLNIKKIIRKRHRFYKLPFIMPFCSSDSLVGLDLMKLNSLLRNFPLSRLPSSFELPFRTETKQKPFPAIRKKCLCIFFCINPWYSPRLGIFY